MKSLVFPYFSKMLSLILFSLTLISLTRGEVFFYAADNGTKPWLTYTNVSVSFGYNNGYRLWAENTISFLDLSIMLCSDQYDTGNETCCVVGVLSVIDLRDMHATMLRSFFQMTNVLHSLTQSTLPI